MESMIQFLYRKIPTRLTGRMRSSALARQIVARWVRNRTVKIATGVGAGLLFNPANSNPAYATGTNELPVQAALAGCLRPGSVFYDIGANVGFFTVIGARLTGPQGRVYAFEPSLENTACLRQNIAQNRFDQVTVIPRAVSSSSGTGELLLTGLSGGATLAGKQAPPDVSRVQPVELVSIDELLQRAEIRPPDVVKIDVEGAELDVLAGMEAAIQAYQPALIVEVDDADPAAARAKLAEITDFLQARGYTARELESSYPGNAWHVLHLLAEANAVHG